MTIEERITKLDQAIQLAKDNLCHVPSGPTGGQFCATGVGSGSGGRGSAVPSGFLRNAERASRSADRMSAKAGQKGTAAAHQAAAKEHRYAWGLNNGVGNRDKASYHQEKEKYHTHAASTTKLFGTTRGY